MSWDIHGEPLRPGHCEVHPWVGESYPCALCLAETRMHEDARREEEEYWRAEQDAFYSRMQMDEWVADDLGPVALAGATEGKAGEDR